MYRVYLTLKVYDGPARGYRHISTQYLSETLPDITALRTSRGVFDVAIREVATGHYCY